jgi:tight adherence protein C
MNTLLNFYYLILDNIDYFGFLALIFLSTVTVVIAVYFLIGRQSVATERLSRLLPGKKEASGSKPQLLSNGPQGFVAKFTKPLHDVVVPKEGATKKKARLKLIRAGFRSELAFQNYMASKMVFALLLPGIYLAMHMFYRFTPDVILISSLLAVSGFFLPNLYIWLATKGRQDGMTKALPDALDLMVVCVEAGLGLDMTFKRVGDEVRPINKDLSEEFRLTNLEIRAGRSRDESFKDMATRTGVPEIHNLMTVLVQTSRFGTSLAKALRVHADAMRVKRRQRAEEQAAKSTVKLIFPLVLFIFPAIFVVLVGPAAVQIAKVLIPVLSGQGGG